MRKVLIVSPRFVPTSAPDLHRVRTTVGYLAENGWLPLLLAVRPALTETGCDSLLSETLPDGLKVHEVNALPASVTRKAGLGDLGIRAFPFLYKAGLDIIRRESPDLVFFSTTAFTTLPLGRLWKRKTGVPFVIDLQDPWHSDYYKDKPRSERPKKHWFSSRLHGALEPWTMKAVDGIISVSADYIAMLRERYPWLNDRPCMTLPFGFFDQDIEVARDCTAPNPFFESCAESINGVYVGRAGYDMERALQIMFGALATGIEREPSLFSKVRLFFIGTDYAPGSLAKRWVAPVAERIGVGDRVQEFPNRVPYFQALRTLLDADFLIVPGSDDAQYTASKIYPYIATAKPMLAAFHERSSVCDVLRDTSAGELVTFSEGSSVEELAVVFYKNWSRVLDRLPYTPDTDWRAFSRYSAQEMTRQQCALFDRVLDAVGNPSRAALATGGIF